MMPAMGDGAHRRLVNDRNGNVTSIIFAQRPSQPQVLQLYRPYSVPVEKTRVMGSAQLWSARGKADIQNTCEFHGESIHSLLM